MSNHPVWHTDTHSGNQSPISPLAHTESDVRGFLKSSVGSQHEYERPSFSARHHSSDNVAISGDYPSHLTTPSMDRHKSDPGHQGAQDTIKGNRHSPNRFGWPSPRPRPTLSAFITDSLNSADGNSDDASKYSVPTAVRERADSTGRSHIPVRTRKTSESSAAGNESDKRSRSISSSTNSRFTGKVSTSDNVSSPTLSQELELENDITNQQGETGMKDTDTAAQSVTREKDVCEAKSMQHDELLFKNDNMDNSDIFLSTPKKQFSFQRPQMEFQTPSPPRNMPDLPGPPLSSDGEDTDRTPPVRLPKSSTLDDIKTPRPPGAWGTPLAIPALARSQSVPPEDEILDKVNDVGDLSISAPPTYSRAQTNFPETPAPPGAWMATPGTTRRRSILKVRFDDETRKDLQSGQSTQVPSAVRSAEDSTANQSENTLQNSYSIGEAQLPSTPVLFRPLRTPKRSPTVRMVDAFGKELPQEPPVSVEDNTNSDRNILFPQSSLSRSQKSKIRVVDAMGKEVSEEKLEKLPVEEDGNYSSTGVALPDEVTMDNIAFSKPAKEVLRDTIYSMKKDMALFDLYVFAAILCLSLCLIVSGWQVFRR